MTKICFPCNPPFIVSQRFGENYDYYFKNFKQKGHNGWDFAIPVGTPLYACHNGTVTFCKLTDFGDLAISITDSSGTFRTVYGHLSEFKVKLGDVVKKGQLVALSGNTGRYTTGPHLHFGIHEVKDGVDLNNNNGFSGGVDPALYWDGTYPKDYKLNTTQPPHVTEFIIALNKFQEAEGIKPAPVVGPKTTASFKKYKLLN